MTRPTIEQARSWPGLTLVATDEPAGEIEAIYVDRTTRQPEWALVDTGAVGGSRPFVPLVDAAQQGDTVQVPYQSTMVREAPRLEQDAELSEADKARLYAHYGIQYTTEESSSGLPAGPTMGGRSARAARKAVEAGQQAAASGRLAVHKARQEVAAVVAAIETTPESKRAAHRRTRARKRAMAAAAGAARSLVAVLAAALRRARKSDAGQGSS